MAYRDLVAEEIHDLIYDVMLKSALVLQIIQELDDAQARRETREELAQETLERERVRVAMQ
jgi:hypothetical protein